MLFTTDKQTLADLNIFGKQGSDCIYYLFNRCATRGGAAVLEEMFRYPLSNETAIKNRSTIIQCFVGLNFPFEAVYFEAAETYLANTDERTRLMARPSSIGKRIGDMVAADADTRQLHSGVRALAGILQQAQAFITAPVFAGTLTPDAWRVEKEAMRALISDPALAAITGHQQKPGPDEMATWDALLRFKHRDSIQKLLQLIYRLDVYIAVAGVAKEHGFCFPKALSSEMQTLSISNVYHPQVKNAVPNQISFDSTSNLVFLTGANMAGKSTFMKTVSIAVFLAQMGFPVPAEEMEFSVFNGMYTTINLPDNLGMGASHFYAEVLRVKKVAAELNQGKRLFIVFDELFRGTNVKDAYEATIAITTGFAAKRNSVFVISTHIIEAGTPLAQACANISFLYLPTTMNGQQPVYTYKLQQGISADRHGMLIVNNEGVLDILEQNSREKTTGEKEVRFIVDKQSLEDLNLLGKFRPHSIFSLFNGVVTHGGERLLNDMFQQPMTNAAAINSRSMLFRYFQKKQCCLPVSRKLVESMEQYLQAAGSSSPLVTATGIMRRKMTKLLLRDELYDQWKDGLLATVSALQQIAAFLHNLDDYPFPEELYVLRRFFSDTRLSALLGAGEAKDFSILQMARYQHMLLQEFRASMEELLKIIYLFDVCIAVSRVAGEKGFTYANALPAEAEVFRASGIWHPRLDKPVANPLSFNSDQNLLFLTGANMAGKSTLMKSFGIAVYLAHMGFPVAATELNFSVMDGLYCSINVPDSLTLGYSHFYAEVLRVKTVAEEVAAGKRLVVLFDELFKGTNVKDAYDATLACTSAFAMHTRCFYIISTHITEVGEVLKKNKGSGQFAYLPTEMRGTVPHYTYRLTEGISTDRQGMLIIQNEGILEMM